MVKPLKGVVVSNKMMKSVTVMVERIYKPVSYTHLRAHET